MDDDRPLGSFVSTRVPSRLPKTKGMTSSSSNTPLPPSPTSYSELECVEYARAPSVYPCRSYV